MQFLLAAGK